MVSYFISLIESRYSIDDAVKIGTQRRLRPVLMTAFIAGFGLLPLLLSSGVGSEIQRPLAIVILGGLATSSILTLLITTGIQNSNKKGETIWIRFYIFILRIITKI